MTSAAIRVYTAIVALVCTAAITFALSAHDRSQRWSEQAAYWESMAARTAHHDRLTDRSMRRLAVRYHRLVAGTRRSQARLLHALKAAERQQLASASSAAAAATVYRSSYVSAGGSASAPVPAPTPAPPPPTTKAS